jgi:F-type H+-transporting ATPase subunit b
MDALTVLAAEGGETPNVLGVPLGEFILGLIAFAIVFGFLSRIALPAITKTLDERANAIEGGIARAAEAEAEAQRSLEQYKSQLAAAYDEASSIRTAAQAEKASIIESARSEAAAAAAAVTARAEAQMAAERASATSSLKREVSDLALVLAGKVVGESLTDDARARGVVDRFIADLENEANASGTANSAGAGA